MNDPDSISIRGRGRDTLLPAGGLPFGDVERSQRPAATPESFLSLSVADAFAAVDWEGTKALQKTEIDLSQLTVEEFFERFRWDATA